MMVLQMSPPEAQKNLLKDGKAFVEQFALLKKLADKGYAGPLSVELFLPKFQQGDPYEIAREIRLKAEGVMRQARVA